MPVPAVPDPKITIRASLILTLLTCRAAMSAASVTQPVPWTSSLKQAISERYLSSKRLAFLIPKSSLNRSQYREVMIEKPRNIQMNVCVGEDFPCTPDKSIYKLVVLLSPDPLMPQAEVQLVLEKAFVLRHYSACIRTIKRIRV